IRLLDVIVIKDTLTSQLLLSGFFKVQPALVMVSAQRRWGDLCTRCAKTPSANSRPLNQPASHFCDIRLPTFNALKSCYHTICSLTLRWHDHAQNTLYRAVWLPVLTAGGRLDPAIAEGPLSGHRRNHRLRFPILPDFHAPSELPNSSPGHRLSVEDRSRCNPPACLGS